MGVNKNWPSLSLSVVLPFIYQRRHLVRNWPSIVRRYRRNCRIETRGGRNDRRILHSVVEKQIRFHPSIEPTDRIVDVCLLEISRRRRAVRKLVPSGD